MLNRVAGRAIVSALVLIAAGAPVEAATAGKIAGTNQIKLDPEKGDVRASLAALAQTSGIKVTGDSASLAEPVSTGPITGTPAQLLKRLLRGHDYVIKTDKTGRISEVVIMSGKRGKDPVMQAAAPPAAGKPAQTAAAAAPISPVTAALMAKAEQSQVRPMPPGAQAQANFPGGSGAADQAAISPPPAATGAPPVITPEMQAQIAASTQQAQAQLQVLVQQLKAACPAGQRC